MVRAESYFDLASQQQLGEDIIVDAVILQIVAEKVADSTRLTRATAFLRRFPAQQVRAARQVLLLPNGNATEEQRGPG